MSGPAANLDSSGFRALSFTAALPDSVFGPVLYFALMRLDSVFLRDI